jgi:hypothetical protein
MRLVPPEPGCDLGAVAFIDSTGIEVPMDARTLALERECSLTLLGARGCGGSLSLRLGRRSAGRREDRERHRWTR